MSKTYADLMRDASMRFEDAEIKTALLDARRLLAGAAKLEPAALISKSRDSAEQHICERYEKFIQLRIEGKPVYRILGEREFYSRPFKIFDDVLDPRPETELLVERVLEDWKGKSPDFAEIGVGSGAIAVSLLCELPGATCVATDICDKAIKAAGQNAARHKVDARLRLEKTDCLDLITEKFDFIVSNPPYIESGAIKELEVEVREYDPKTALDGGVDGLDIYRQIFFEAKKSLKSDTFKGDFGQLYLETGHNQHAALIKLASSMGWGLVSNELDLYEKERILVLRVLK